MKYAPPPQPARYEVLWLLDVGSVIKGNPVLMLWNVVVLSKLYKLVRLSQEVPSPAMLSFIC